MSVVAPSPATPASPVGFTLRVPASWLEFDVWQATRSSLLKRMLDERLAEAVELAPHRRALLKLLREVAEDAERQGAVFCAVMLDDFGAAGVLAATVMVFHTEGAPDPADNTVEAIAGQVSAHDPDDSSPAWRHVELVDLAAGRAVRVSGVELASSPGRPALDGVVMQTLVPVPGEAGGVLNVVLSSPQTALVDPMLELFQQITSTLAWSSASAPGSGPVS